MHNNHFDQDVFQPLSQAMQSRDNHSVESIHHAIGTADYRFCAANRAQDGCDAPRSFVQRDGQANGPSTLSPSDDFGKFGQERLMGPDSRALVLEGENAHQEPSAEKSCRPVRRRDHNMPLLIFVEGGNDIEFLKGISRILHTSDSSLPDLTEMEHAGQLAFIPFGGSAIGTWIDRLANLGCREFHLYDREVPPTTTFRQEMARIVNRRAPCRAILTRKRNMENYLHPRAIFDASGTEIDVDDDGDVADSVAESRFLHQRPGFAWSDLSARARRRFRNSVKRWLNISAVERMSLARLVDRGASGEVCGWLKCIAEMAGCR